MSDIEYVELHDLANLYPEMGTREFINLVMSIKKIGLNRPVDVWCVDRDDISSWKVIDGRHRQKACIELGIECEYNYMVFDEFEDALQYVAAQNHTRRSSINEKRTNKQKNAEALAEIARDPDRSDRMIGELLKISHPTIAKVREKIGAMSGNRKGSDGKVNLGPKIEMEKNPNISISPEPATSAPEEPKQAVSDDHGMISADQLAKQLFPSYQKNSLAPITTKIRKVLDSKLGKVMAERYDGHEAPKNMLTNLKNNGVDLRIGWPNLGSAFASQNSFAPGNTKKGYAMANRAADLDLINKANEGEGDNRQSLNTEKWINNMSLLTSPPIRRKRSAEEDAPEGFPIMRWHGVVISWWEVEGMDFKTAHCTAQLIEDYCTSITFEQSQNPNHEDRPQDHKDLSRSVAFLGDYLQGIGGPSIRRVVDMMATAMHNHPEKSTTIVTSPIGHKIYHTSQ